MIYFFNISYVVCYHIAKFELKTPLVYEETKKQIVLRCKFNRMLGSPYRTGGAYRRPPGIPSGTVGIPLNTTQIQKTETKRL
jgi:hypothetical protein